MPTVVSVPINPLAPYQPLRPDNLPMVNNDFLDFLRGMSSRALESSIANAEARRREAARQFDANLGLQQQNFGLQETLANRANEQRQYENWLAQMAPNLAQAAALQTIGNQPSWRFVTDPFNGGTWQPVGSMSLGRSNTASVAAPSHKIPQYLMGGSRGGTGYY